MNAEEYLFVDIVFEKF